jgi:hypothetical protein
VCQRAAGVSIQEEAKNTAGVTRKRDWADKQVGCEILERRNPGRINRKGKSLNGGTNVAGGEKEDRKRGDGGHRVLGKAYLDLHFKTIPLVGGEVRVVPA